jgi:F420-0:gamma-glutamyl ligase-like protein
MKAAAPAEPTVEVKKAPAKPKPVAAKAPVVKASMIEVVDVADTTQQRDTTLVRRTNEAIALYAEDGYTLREVIVADVQRFVLVFDKA